MYKPDIGIGALHMFFLHTLFPFTQLLLPETWRLWIVCTTFPRGFYARYTGEWHRLDSDKLPDWVKRQVWEEVFKNAPRNPFATN